MKINKAAFVISNTDVSKCPQDPLPEYAFIGRSNVGKSSLINLLVNNRKLAKISGKPGKTQLINHFIINDSWFLVDLPGYGYASVSKGKRKVFQGFIQDYFIQRKNLINAFVLVDSRHTPQKIDLEFMQWLGEHGIPFSIVFTKIDKLPSSKLNNTILKYKKKLAETWDPLPPSFLTSATAKHGAETLLNYIDAINKQVAGKIEM